MKRSACYVFVFLALVLSTGAFAERVTYSVDAGSVTPQAATVVNRPNGSAWIVIQVPEFVPGNQVSFQVDLALKGGENGTYPATGGLRVVGKPVFDLSVDPEQVTFADRQSTVSCLVTLTLKEGNYDHKKKIVTLFKTAMDDASSVGNGPGIKVVLIRHAAESAPAPEERDAVIRELLRLESQNPIGGLRFKE